MTDFFASKANVYSVGTWTECWYDPNDDQANVMWLQPIVPPWALPATIAGAALVLVYCAIWWRQNGEGAVCCGCALDANGASRLRAMRRAGKEEQRAREEEEMNDEVALGAAFAQQAAEQQQKEGAAKQDDDGGGGEGSPIAATEDVVIELAVI